MILSASETDGPVIEFGCGNEITDWLERHSQATGRLVQSVTTDREIWWRLRHQHHYQHSVLYTRDYFVMIPHLGEYTLCILNDVGDLADRIADEMAAHAGRFVR